MNSTLPFKIHRFKQIDSTNSAALRLAREGAPAGSVLVADYQTKGRGKWGRTWVSPRGKNLLFSLLLKPRLKALQAAGITQAACRSVARVLQQKFGIHPTFKRPNDVLVDGKKICGVLVEAEGRSNGDLEALVVGIGLNVNAVPQKVTPKATSLRKVTGKTISRSALLAALLNQLRKDLECYS